jgi:hypothetical protein
MGIFKFWRTETMANDSSSKQFNPEKDCQKAPIPNWVNDNKLPSDLDYDLEEYSKLPKTTKKSLDDAYELARLNAEQKLNDAKLDYQDLLLGAQSAYDLSVKKSETKKTKLENKIKNDVGAAYKTYVDAKESALANLKSCITPPDNPPDWIHAELIAQLLKTYADKTKEYQESLKPIVNEKMVAEALYTQAVQDSQDALCKAQSENDIAISSANYDRRKALRDEIEKLS